MADNEGYVKFFLSPVKLYIVGTTNCSFMSDLILGSRHGATLGFYLKHFRIIRVSIVLAHSLTLDCCTSSV